MTTDYYNEIESHFALRGGTPFILSAKDCALMKKWHGEGVPLGRHASGGMADPVELRALADQIAAKIS